MVNGYTSWSEAKQTIERVFREIFFIPHLFMEQ